MLFLCYIINGCISDRRETLRSGYKDFLDVVLNEMDIVATQIGRRIRLKTDLLPQASVKPARSEASVGLSRC